jgi:SOS response regulatory protein OraA/RecX
MLSVFYFNGGDRMEVGKLVFDDEILRIRPINDVFVSRYRQAMREGAKFPTVVIEKKTNKIISGNHRVNAYLQEYGIDHEIEVIEKVYKNRGDMIAEAARENATHGNPLDGISRKRFTIALSKYGYKPEQIASIFGVAVTRVEEWGGHTVCVIGKNGSRTQEPVKRGFPLEEVAEVTQKQYERHARVDGGCPAWQSSEQLIRWLDNGWISRDDKRSMDALKELNKAIVKFLG